MTRSGEWMTCSVERMAHSVERMTCSVERLRADELLEKKWQAEREAALAKCWRESE